MQCIHVPFFIYQRTWTSSHKNLLILGLVRSLSINHRRGMLLFASGVAEESKACFQNPQDDFYNFWVYRIVILHRITSYDPYRRIWVIRECIQEKRNYCKGNRSFRWYRESSEKWYDTYSLAKHWKAAFSSLLPSSIVSILDTQSETSYLNTRIFSSPLWLAPREM